MLNPKERKIKVSTFLSNENGEKDIFIQTQRLIWERRLFPSRFPKSSFFLCSICSSSNHTLSVCLKCRKFFCLKHFKIHGCKNSFGLDIKTQQLFYFDSNKNRQFIFDAYIDRYIYSIKYAVIDCLPLDTILDYPDSTIFSPLRPPIALQNLGNTCWMSALLQCLLVNPLLQKWFLSQFLPINEPQSSVELLHILLTRLFLTQINEKFSPSFNLAELVYTVWQTFPQFATPDQHDSAEFFTQLRTTLNDFYQNTFHTSSFSNIFEWRFKIYENCENCHSIQIYYENSSDLILHLAEVSTLREAIYSYLYGTSPKPCPYCHQSCQKQITFLSLPLTLSVTINRGHLATPFRLCEYVDLKDFVDESCNKESFNICLNDSDAIRYRLIGEVVRPGQGETGHYWANVYKGGIWWRCDDIKISKVSKEEVLRDNALLLFFIREGYIDD